MSAGLSDPDIRRLIEVFQESGCVELELAFGSTRLRLGARMPARGVIETVASPGVGIFRASISEGDSMNQGDELGRIKSVRAETVVHTAIAGVVSALPVADGAFVEYGGRLAELRVDTR